MKYFRDNLFSMGNSVYRNKTDYRMEPNPCQRYGQDDETDELQFPMYQNSQQGQKQNEHNQKVF